MTPLINLAPQIALVATASLVILVKILGYDGRVNLWIGVAGAFLATVSTSWLDPSLPALHGLHVDAVGILMVVLLHLCVLGGLLYSLVYLTRENLPFAEWTFLLLTATVGLSLMVSTYHLVILFVGLELASLCFYVLCGYRRGSVRSLESSLKYFILGSVGSAVLLMGVALFFASQASLGQPPTLVLNRIDFAAAGPGVSTWMSLFLVGLGLAFKLALVPLQFWVPDVYEGAPTPITAYMSVAVKIAVVGMFIRLIYATGAVGAIPWSAVLWWLAVLTMFGGNLLALVQESVKRMLAYSSIAHAGYVTLGLVAGTTRGFSAAVFYLAVYLVMNLAAFGMIYLVGTSEEQYHYENLQGLSRTHPVLAFCLAVCMISLAGLPPTAGFMGKLMLFYGVVEAGYGGLALAAVLASVISVAYYFRVIVHSYMKSPEEAEATFAPADTVASSVSVLAMVFLLFVGVSPGWLYGVIGRIVSGLM